MIINFMCPSKMLRPEKSRRHFAFICRHCLIVVWNMDCFLWEKESRRRKTFKKMFSFWDVQEGIRNCIISLPPFPQNVLYILLVSVKAAPPRSRSNQKYFFALPRDPCLQKCNFPFIHNFPIHFRLTLNNSKCNF